MDAEDPKTQKLVGDLAALKSRGIAGAPCLQCCKGATLGWRKLLREVGRSLVGLSTGQIEQSEVVLDDLGVTVGLLEAPRWNPLADPPVIVRPEVPPPAPVKPMAWGAGWSRILLVQGLAPSPEESARIGGYVGRTLLALASLGEEPNRPKSDSLDFCEACIATSLWGQDNPQKKEVATIRRRV